MSDVPSGLVMATFLCNDASSNIETFPIKSLRGFVMASAKTQPPGAFIVSGATGSNWPFPSRSSSHRKPKPFLSLIPANVF